MMTWQTIGLWAGIILPLWDIPLIIRIIRRKSSGDISVIWMWGIWASSVLMAPVSFIKHETQAIAFNIVNIATLTVLLIVVLKYQQPNPRK